MRPLYPYGRRFYIDQPAWMSSDSRLRTIPIFYLTNNLTREQDERIRHDLVLGGWASDDHLKCCFVPWKKTGEGGEGQGTLEDIWEIFWTVRTYEGPDFPHSIYFIDEQSADDMKVIGVRERTGPMFPEPF